MPFLFAQPKRWFPRSCYRQKDFLLSINVQFNMYEKSTALKGLKILKNIYKKNILVDRWATRLPILVAQILFLVVPGARTLDLSSPK